MNAPLDLASVGATGGTSIVLIGLIVSTIELLIGVAVGWWLRGGKPASAQEQPNSAHDSAEKLKTAEHALINVQELTASMQADVGAHTSQMEAISNQLTKQSDGKLQDQGVVDAVTKILAANQQLEQRLQTAESKLQLQAEQIRVHATNALTDALTGLCNRRAFDAELTRRTAEFQRYGKTFCLLMLDIDHFKQFNDTHGHLAGDEVLRLVGATLKATVRTPDFVARYGGEEFAIIMPQTSLTEAQRGGERVRLAIEQAQCVFEDKTLRVTASIGLTQVAVGQSVPTLIHCADEALYRAKQAGRNQVQVHESLEELHPTSNIATDHAASDAQKPAKSLTEKLPESPVAATDDLRTDTQTGLLNRTAFCEDTRRRLAEAQRHGTQLSVMLIKLDRLGELVALHGQPFESLALRTCTQFLCAAMREMDLVARYDNDVFGVVLPGTSLMHAAGASERLRAAIEHCPMQMQGRQIPFTVSIGVAEAEADEDMISFIKRAVATQQAAASAGGNRVDYHTGTSIETLPQPTAAAPA